MKHNCAIVDCNKIYQLIKTIKPITESMDDDTAEGN